MASTATDVDEPLTRFEPWLTLLRVQSRHHADHSVSEPRPSWGPELERRRPRPKFAAEKLTLPDTALLHASRARQFRNRGAKFPALWIRAQRLWIEVSRHRRDARVRSEWPRASKYLANFVDENRKEFILVRSQLARSRVSEILR